MKKKCCFVRIADLATALRRKSVASFNQANVVITANVSIQRSLLKALPDNIRQAQGYSDQI